MEFDSNKAITIDSLDWRRYRLPFRADFATSQGATQFRYGAIARVSLRDGQIGVGEVAPLPLNHPAALDKALQPAPELAAVLAGQTLEVALGWLGQSAQSDTKLAAPLICGVEMALLDALSKQQDSSLAATLHGTGKRATVPVNAVIGAGNLEESVRSARLAVEAGFTCVKLKVGLPHDQVEHEIELVGAVRESIGPDIDLRLDANGGWNLSQATIILSGCEPYDIQYVEQPLPATCLEELQALRRVTPVPIALDEALTDLYSARRILDSGAADVLVIKPQVVGGLLVSRQIIREAAARGTPCVLTSSIESGIGIAATLQLAAGLPELRLACGLGTLPLLADDLILEPLPVGARGAIHIPEGAGLGVTLDEQALNRYMVLT